MSSVVKSGANDSNHNHESGQAAVANKHGVDALLTRTARALPSGDSISVRLIKGPDGTISADPVDPKASTQAFPLIAKFPESVVKPNFTCFPWSESRMYQQDAPKPVEDDDSDNDNHNEDNINVNRTTNKKRWKGLAKRPDQAIRQWILQEKVDFLETMVSRREKKKPQQQQRPTLPSDSTTSSSNHNHSSSSSSSTHTHALSSRFEGTPESNPSTFALLMQSGSHISLRMLPPSSTVTFAQPGARKTLTLLEAEQVIQDQRMNHNMNVQRRTMHSLLDHKDHNNNNNNQEPHRQLSVPLHKTNNSKSRLLEKLAKTSLVDNGGVEEETDDVMGDVRFKRKTAAGSSSSSRAKSARNEILESLGDGVAVSEEGVLGGTNDAVFGGRNRFSNFVVANRQQHDDYEEEAPNLAQERGADGAAMEDNFYQRDVHAEYEELDYDANEQFDDDDVDVGETELRVEGDDGYEQDDNEYDDDDSLDQDETVSGAEGLASVAGFKMMLAKARGEIPQEKPLVEESDAVSISKKNDNVLPAVRKAEENGDFMTKVMNAAQKSAQASKNETTASVLKKQSSAATIRTDENGLRVISLAEVRNEIWLNHGSIQVKRLMKMFDVKKKSSAERQEKFREVIKELCTMKTDALGERLLVLKQHYANVN